MLEGNNTEVLLWLPDSFMVLRIDVARVEQGSLL